MFVRVYRCMWAHPTTASGVCMSVCTCLSPPPPLLSLSVRACVVYPSIHQSTYRLNDMVWTHLITPPTTPSTNHPTDGSFRGSTHSTNQPTNPPNNPPHPQMGMFGAITPLASFPKDRKSLFDTALAGS